MTDPIRILMASDLHFGAPSLNQAEMADAFAKTVFPLLAETDIFFINGDFFDTLVIFDNHGFDPIYDTILNLFALCDQYKVTLRVLQGTWTHDRNQCRRFNTFYRNTKCTFDFRFAEGIEFETITIRDRSIRVMYVPDDLPFKSSDDIVAVIRGKLTELGWDYVDYGCMHGFFDFTFPKAVSQDNVIVFREAQFDFVRKLIDVGHVHQHRIQGDVISNGSFDRLCHGDQDPKGCIRVFDYPDHYTAQFIENKYAAVYDTLVFSDDATTESIRDRIETHLQGIKSDRTIHLRFESASLEFREAIKQWMDETHPEIKKVFKKSKDGADKPMVLPTSALFKPVEKRIAPTPKTISTFIRSNIPEDYSLTIEDIDRHLEPASDKV